MELKKKQFLVYTLSHGNKFMLNVDDISSIWMGRGYLSNFEAVHIRLNNNTSDEDDYCIRLEDLSTLEVVELDADELVGYIKNNWASI